MDELHSLITYDVSKIFSYNFHYISILSIECLTNDVVTHGTPKHSTINEVKAH